MMALLPMMFRYAVHDFLGFNRTQNQDSAYASPQLMAIADGMGGHAGGDVASSLAIEAVVSSVARCETANSTGDLVEMARVASVSIREAVRNDTQLSGMGTTLTTVLCTGSTIALAHIGDSRAYRLRGSTLSLVTHDDTYVQSLVDTGEITVEEAWEHPMRSVVTNVLTGQDVGPDDAQQDTFDSKLADRWLLCSDGLSGFVPEEALQGCLAAGDDVAETAEALVRLSKDVQARDNVTVVVADIVSDGTPGQSELKPVVVGAAADRVRLR